MEGFDFLNTAVGLEYCADDEEIYREVLEGYLEEDRSSDLTDAYNASDWPLYRTIVHGIKSSSLTIGAEALSADAKALEMAAAEENVDFVKANHDRLISDYGELMGKLKEALG